MDTKKLLGLSKKARQERKEEKEKRKQEMSEEEYDKSLQETIELSKIDWLNK